MTDVDKWHWSYRALATWHGLPAQFDLFGDPIILDIYYSPMHRLIKAVTVDPNGWVCYSVCHVKILSAVDQDIRLIGQETELVVNERVPEFDRCVVKLMGRFLDATWASAGRQVISSRQGHSKLVTNMRINNAFSFAQTAFKLF